MDVAYYVVIFFFAQATYTQVYPIDPWALFCRFLGPLGSPEDVIILLKKLLFKK